MAIAGFLVCGMLASIPSSALPPQMSQTALLASAFEVPESPSLDVQAGLLLRDLIEAAISWVYITNVNNIFLEIW